MKSIMTLAISMLIGFAYSSNAQQRGHGPQLTQEQKNCLESKIGKPGEGNRPSREQMDIAFSECGIQKPNFQGARQGPPLFNLTTEQKACLDDIIGQPSATNQPSREKMEAALNECGIQRPTMPSRNFNQNRSYESGGATR